MAGEKGRLKEIRLSAPVRSEDLAGLDLGTVVYLDGVVYTGREGVYRKILDQGTPPPVDLAALSNVNFHCSPAARVEDDGSYTVGAVTATASFRFSKWMARWFALSGAKVIIGKGGMTEADYKAAFVPNGAIYLSTVGYGSGALLGRGVRRVRDVHWLDQLGIAQALWVFEVKDFGPFLVESDGAGNSLFERNNREINRHLDGLYEGLKPPALSRFGETDRRTDDLI